LHHGGRACRSRRRRKKEGRKAPAAAAPDEVEALHKSNGVSEKTLSDSCAHKEAA
jgi:hypothetical protein